MQDDVVWLVERGHPLGMLLELPLPSFDSLYLSSVRLHSKQRAERLRDTFNATQVGGKDIEKIASLLDTIGESSKPKNDMASFLQQHGSGM